MNRSPSPSPSPFAEAEPVVVTPPPVQVDGEPWTTRVCWNCGTGSPNTANDSCLNPGCRRKLVPPALVIEFQYGQVELERGERTMLGRLGRHADAFLPYPNVSREHTNIGVERDGRPWLKPTDAVNGTFLNDKEVTAPEQRELRNKDTLRLGLNCTGTVRVYASGDEAS